MGANRFFAREPTVDDLAAGQSQRYGPTRRELGPVVAGPVLATFAALPVTHDGEP